MKISEPVLTNTDTDDKFLLNDNPSYTGLFSLTQSSKFSFLPINPIYKFPVPHFSAPNRTFFSRDCFLLDQASVSKSLTSIQEKSAFRRSMNSETSSPSILLNSRREAPKNSFNLNSFASQSNQYLSGQFNLAEEMEKNSVSIQNSFLSSVINTSCAPEKANISLNTKEMILDIHRKFTAMQDDFHLNSITPNSKISLNSLVMASEYENSGSDYQRSQASDAEDNIPYFKRTEESLKRSNILVELVPDYKPPDDPNVSRNLSKCTEEDVLSSPDDEGPLHISTARLFLNGETASKAKLSGPVAKYRIIRQLSNKLIHESSSQILTTSPESQPSIEFPDPLSLITKKIVIFEKNSDSAEIRTAFPCSGYCSALCIEYSGNEEDNCIFPAKASQNSFFDLGVANILIETQIEWVSCGFEHSAAVSSEGKVLTWGFGGAGCLGHGSLSDCRIPTLVNSLFELRIAYLECGGYHTVCTTEDGDVYSWGRGDVNQLGVKQEKLTKDKIGCFAMRPLKLKELSRAGVCIKGIACGEAHTLLLDSDGKVYAFGWGEDGQLGFEENNREGVRSVEAMPYKVVKIAAGSVFSACLTDLGQVFVWGNGECGQLGLGNSFIDAGFPSLVSGLRHEFIVDLVCGESSVVCISQTGTVYAWGKGITGSFENEEYSKGSDIICFVPRTVPKVQIVQKMLIKKTPKFDFADELRNKLLKLKFEN